MSSAVFDPQCFIKSYQGISENLMLSCADKPKWYAVCFKYIKTCFIDYGITMLSQQTILTTSIQVIDGVMHVKEAPTKNVHFLHGTFSWWVANLYTF